MVFSHPMMRDIFSVSENNPNNRRAGVTVNRQNKAILWNDLPAELKHAEVLKISKQKIKLWSPNDCSCRICRNFIKKFGIQ